MSNGTTSTAHASTSSAKGLVDRSTFHLAAGLVSGFTSAILLQPADLLKTRIQQSHSDSLLKTLRSITSSPQPIRQLWRGTLPSTIRTSVGSALYFTSLNVLRTHLASYDNCVASAGKGSSAGQGAQNAKHSSNLPRLTPLANLGSGAFARAAVGFIMMPITVIKVRFESSYYAYPSLAGAMRNIWTQEGIKGLFAGFGATALRDAPYAGLYVLFYEQGKATLSRLAPSVKTQADSRSDKAAGRPSSSVAAGINFTSGASAAAMATAITNPPDAIKTRLQLRPDKYKNTLQCARRMLAEEGFKSLFDGLGLRMARKALSSALAWTVYEEVVRRAESRWVTVP